MVVCCVLCVLCVLGVVCCVCLVICVMCVVCCVLRGVYCVLWFVVRCVVLCVVLCVVWCGGVVCVVCCGLGCWWWLLWLTHRKEVVVTFSLQKSKQTQFVRNTKLAQNDKVTVYGARFLQNHHATFWKSMLNLHQSLAACLPLVAFSHTSSSVTQSQIFLVDSATI